MRSVGVIVLGAALLAAGTGAPPALAGQRVDGVAAIVDEHVILLSEVDRQARPILEDLQRRSGAPLPAEVRQEVRLQAVESLIAERLILDAGTRMGLEATDEDVDHAVAGIAQEEGVAPEEIYAAAADQGLARDEYRKRLADQITRMKVVNASVRQRVTVTQQEVRELYDERYGNVRPGLRAEVRHILIPWPDPESATPREASRRVAEQLLEALRQGYSFERLAREYSAAPSAADGGRTSFRQGEVNPELERWAFQLEPGQVSPPIETSHGVNLIQLLERYDPSEVTFEDVEDELRAEIGQRKLDPEIEKWVKTLREQVYVEVVAPELQ